MAADTYTISHLCHVSCMISLSCRSCPFLNWDVHSLAIVTNPFWVWGGKGKICGAIYTYLSTLFLQAHFGGNWFNSFAWHYGHILHSYTSQKDRINGVSPYFQYGGRLAHGHKRIFILPKYVRDFVWDMGIIYHMVLNMLWITKK